MCAPVIGHVEKVEDEVSVTGSSSQSEKCNEEKLSYANVVEFCDAREQSVLPSDKLIVPKIRCDKKELNRSTQRTVFRHKKLYVNRNFKSREVGCQKAQLNEQSDKYTEMVRDERSDWYKDFYYNRYDVLGKLDDTESEEEDASDVCEKPKQLHSNDKKARLRLRGGGTKDRKRPSKDNLKPEDTQSNIESDLQEFETTAKDVNNDSELIHIEIEEIVPDVDITTNEITNCEPSEEIQEIIPDVDITTNEITNCEPSEEIDTKDNLSVNERSVLNSKSQTNDNIEDHDIDTTSNEKSVLTEASHIADTSVAEIIELLNCKDNKDSIAKENIGCETSTENNFTETVELSEGQVFKTYGEFKTKFDAWCVQHNHPVNINSSKRTEDKSLSETDFPFQHIRFTCKDAGKPRVKSHGKRRVQVYLPCECPMSLRLKLDHSTLEYKITKLDASHNHTTSVGEFKHYSTSRRLGADEKETIQMLVDLNVEIKKHQNIVKRKNGQINPNKRHQ